MQTLTRTLFPCYAPADRELAASIAAFLERGADVRVFLPEGEIGPGEDLAAKAREARTADIVLVMFSRSSMPSRWPRSEWEDALVNEPAEEGIPIAFVKCDDCVPPRVLTPRFDLDGGAVRAMRMIKRWIRTGNSARPATPAGGRETDLDLLGIAIADRPGTETVDDRELALEFARLFAEDYDAVLTVECTGRSLAALAGDLGVQLGLKLEGPVEENISRIRQFCHDRRFLLQLDGIAEDQTAPLIPGGRCSTLISTELVPRSSEDPLLAVQSALTRMDSRGWSEICRLARIGRRITREQDRIAECYELMRQWYEAAEERDDRAVLDESARELVWILETWDRIDEARALEYKRATEFGDQMVLF